MAIFSQGVSPVLSSSEVIPSVPFRLTNTEAKHILQKAAGIRPDLSPDYS
jgi:hypothetical protein